MGRAACGLTAFNNLHGDTSSGKPWPTWVLVQTSIFGNLRHFGLSQVLAVGYALLIQSVALLTSLCIAFTLVWLIVWRMEVGSLWRTSLVSAVILGGGILCVCSWNTMIVRWGVPTLIYDTLLGGRTVVVAAFLYV